jgi:excisionase family DNA binding protein
MPDASDRMLTTRQVAERLGVSIRTVETWRYRGEGPPGVSLARKAVRYPEAALEAWLAERWQREATRAAG